MKIAYRITLPEPCTEDWNLMRPKGCGRFCGNCTKTVIDFTHFSDEEFISFFQKTKTIPCGRFAERQFSIVITPLPKPVFEFPKISRYLATGFLALSGLAGKAEARSWRPVTTSTASQNTPDNITGGTPLLLKGIIKNEQGEAVAGATIRIKGSQQGTVADVEGLFELELPETAETWTLIFQGIDVQADTLIINRSSFDAGIPFTIIMKTDTSTAIIIPGSHINPHSYTGSVETISITAFQAIPGGNPNLMPSLKPTLWQKLTKPFRKNK